MTSNKVFAFTSSKSSASKHSQLVLSWQNKQWRKRLSRITKHANITLLLLLADDICTNPMPLNFAFINVRFFKSKYSSIDHFIQSTESDIFCRTETWLTPSDIASAISDITPAGYTFYHLPRGNKRGAGVGIVIRKCISHELIKLSLLLLLFDLVFNVVCIYRPLTSSTAKLLEEFSSFIKFFFSRPPETLFCFDLTSTWTKQIVYRRISVSYWILLTYINILISLLLISNILISLPICTDIFLTFS